MGIGLLKSIPAVAVFCLVSAPCPAAAAAAAAPVKAVGVETQYADVIAQIGGRYVTVSAIISDPNTDPHEFELNPKIAARLAGAQLVVENGLGYDDWAGRMLDAAPDAQRRVINVQRLLGLPDNTPNPHLWYDPLTMPRVADALAAILATMQPQHADDFRANAARFDASLGPWRAALAAIKSADPGVPVAVTEPVGDALLTAAGAEILTPFTLQAAIMNGTDPAPQDVAAQDLLLSGHKVRALVYNEQVTDPLTASFLALARANHIPVVGVYETMPAPGYDYQSWMLAETMALRAAVEHGQSTPPLGKAPG
ncbi:MAG: zinc ABC transporter substrate-binding protein [Acidocella sp.]|nr:zinc ABC transporter substrate-binding protein [Acidocella sp.]